jgi:hypothetical protein
MSAVLYARLPEALKQALEAYGSTRGLTLTGAAVELLEQGLRASREERSRSELKATLAACRSEREQAQVRLKEAELRLQGAREREQLTAATYASLAERTRQELASCPRWGSLERFTPAADASPKAGTRARLAAWKRRAHPTPINLKDPSFVTGGTFAGVALSRRPALSRTVSSARS